MTKIALCLSGGGFRASLFHLGVLKRLHELDLVKQIELLSAVSGGAVTAAVFKRYATIESELTADGEVIDRSFVFDCNEFERRLLQVTRAGLLGDYMRSMAIYLFLLVTAALLVLRFILLQAPLSYSTSSWLGGLLFSLGASSLVLAGCLHASLVPVSWRDATGRRDAIRVMKNLDTAKLTYNLSRLPPFLLGLLRPLSPNAMRTATLDRKLFAHTFIGSLQPPPKIYLSAMELNRGCEMVFSTRVLAELNAQGSAALWEQMPHVGAEVGFNHERYGYPFQSSYDCDFLPVSEAVAASSAYPPFFRPVTIRRENDHGLVGTFVDGGVLDNAALNVPVEMLIHVSQERGRFRNILDEFGRRTTPVSFTETVTHLLMANAGALPVNATRRWWSSWKSLRRSVDAMYNHQEVNADIKVELLKKVGGIQVAQIATWVTPPADEQLRDNRIGHLLARVRTHFGRFDEVETALLVYFGYYWTDEAMGHLVKGRSPRQNFREIAKAVTGSDAVGKLSCDDIVYHLTWSNRRSAFRRAVGRALGH
jgi:hypothetical protein